MADDGEDTPTTFCADFLAALQERKISFRRAESLSGWGKSTIAAAARGPALPNIELVADVLGAIGIDASEIGSWRARHALLRRGTQSLLDSRDALPRPDTVPDTAPDSGPDSGLVPSSSPVPAPPRRRVEVVVLAVVGLAVVLVLVAVVLVVVLDPRPAGPITRTVVVQNKIATGSSTLIEDDSPSYLGARPVARCANLPGCKIAGTDLSSGDTVVAECQLQGDFITNADVRSPGIGQNPNAATSSLWLGARAPDGRRGYISEVYLAPPYRGGLGLPPC